MDRRIGESACRRLQSVVNFFETSVIIAVSKSGLTSPDAHTPTRRPASPINALQGRA
jgi:hypothetical protein